MIHISPMERVFLLLAVCISIIGYAVERKIIKPWREKRRQRRLITARFAQFALESELRRQRIASAKNGRTARTNGLRETPPVA
jgi:hypothetical protein